MPELFSFRLPQMFGFRLPLTDAPHPAAPPFPSGTSRRFSVIRRARSASGLLNVEIFYILKEAQVLIQSWRCRYNAIRPHGSAG